MLSSEELAAIKAREQAATAGPWYVAGRQGWNCGEPYIIAGNEDPDLGTFIANMDPDAVELIQELPVLVANAEFIRHARTDVPALPAEVERLTAQRDRLLAAADRADAQGVHVMSTSLIRDHLKAADGGETPCSAT